jgi:hypothetical protein
MGAGNEQGLIPGKKRIFFATASRSALRPTQSCYLIHRALMKCKHKLSPSGYATHPKVSGVQTRQVTCLAFCAIYNAKFYLPFRLDIPNSNHYVFFLMCNVTFWPLCRNSKPISLFSSRLIQLNCHKISATLCANHTLSIVKTIIVIINCNKSQVIPNSTDWYLYECGKFIQLFLKYCYHKDQGHNKG